MGIIACTIRKMPNTSILIYSTFSSEKIHIPIEDEHLWENKWIKTIFPTGKDNKNIYFYFYLLSEAIKEEKGSTDSSTEQYNEL